MTWRLLVLLLFVPALARAAIPAAFAQRLAEIEGRTRGIAALQAAVRERRAEAGELNREIERCKEKRSGCDALALLPRGQEAADKVRNADSALRDAVIALRAKRAEAREQAVRMAHAASKSLAPPHCHAAMDVRDLLIAAQNLADPETVQKRAALTPLRPQPDDGPEELREKADQLRDVIDRIAREEARHKADRARTRALMRSMERVRACGLKVPRIAIEKHRESRSLHEARTLLHRIDVLLKPPRGSDGGGR